MKRESNHRDLVIRYDSLATGTLAQLDSDDTVDLPLSSQSSLALDDLGDQEAVSSSESSLEDLLRLAVGSRSGTSYFFHCQQGNGSAFTPSTEAPSPIKSASRKQQLGKGLVGRTHLPRTSLSASPPRTLDRYTHEKEESLLSYEESIPSRNEELEGKKKVKRQPNLAAQARLLTRNTATQAKCRQKYDKEKVAAAEEKEKQRQRLKLKPSAKALKISERLFLEAKRKRERREAEFQREESKLIKEEEKGFKPAILAYSKHLASSTGYRSPDKRESFSAESARQWARLEKEAAELRECSFSPAVSPVSRSIVEALGASESTRRESSRRKRRPHVSLSGSATSLRLFREGEERQLRQRILETRHEENVVRSVSSGPSKLDESPQRAPVSRSYYRPSYTKPNRLSGESGRHTVGHRLPHQLQQGATRAGDWGCPASRSTTTSGEGRVKRSFYSPSSYDKLRVEAEKDAVPLLADEDPLPPLLRRVERRFRALFLKFSTHLGVKSAANQGKSGEVDILEDHSTKKEVPTLTIRALHPLVNQIYTEDAFLIAAVRSLMEKKGWSEDVPLSEGDFSSLLLHVVFPEKAPAPKLRASSVTAKEKQSSGRTSNTASASPRGSMGCGKSKGGASCNSVRRAAVPASTEVGASGSYAREFAMRRSTKKASLRPGGSEKVLCSGVGATGLQSPFKCDRVEIRGTLRELLAEDSSKSPADLCKQAAPSANGAPNMKRKSTSPRSRSPASRERGESLGLLEVSSLSSISQISENEGRGAPSPTTPFALPVSEEDARKRWEAFLQESDGIGNPTGGKGSNPRTCPPSPVVDRAVWEGAVPRITLRKTRSDLNSPAQAEAMAQSRSHAVPVFLEVPKFRLAEKMNAFDGDRSDGSPQLVDDSLQATLSPPERSKPKEVSPSSSTGPSTATYPLGAPKEQRKEAEVFSRTTAVPLWAASSSTKHEPLSKDTLEPRIEVEGPVEQWNADDRSPKSPLPAESKPHYVEEILEPIQKPSNQSGTAAQGSHERTDLEFFDVVEEVLYANDLASIDQLFQSIYTQQYVDSSSSTIRV